SVHCLSLRTGELLWKQKRADDLYLAGVHNSKVLLVGKSACRALNLADGKQLWRTETGLPSGQGVADDNVYYLPLRAGAQSREPEVCPLDIDKGTILAHTRSHRQEVPGNLLFFDSLVLSQTATHITAYQQLRVKLQQIDKVLGQKPKDPLGLTERGDMKLQQGDLMGGIEDLRTALANQPPPNVLPRTRRFLFEALTELLQRDFNAGEKYLAEYKALCEVSIPAETTADERKGLEEEQQRRRCTFLTLSAKGREQQGRLLDAFQAYT